MAITTTSFRDAVRVKDLDQTGRKAALGAFFGLAVDFYDIYLPVVALTPAIIFFEPKNLSPQLVATLGFFVFAVTLIGRPIGAFIFGHLADVVGRKRTTMIAVGGFAVFTFIIALLPGYQTWGLPSLLVLIALRLVDGIFMGGEYTSANPLAMEACPRPLRGLIGGIIQAAYPIAYVAISITTVIMLALVPAGNLNSPYVQWGWRIPFFVGAILGGLFLIYYWRVEESRVWESEGGATRTSAPLKELFRGDNVRNLGQVFLLQSGQWLAVQAAISAMPALLQNVLKLPAEGVTTALLVANIALACGYIVLAVLGQMHGRRLWLIISGCWMGTVCVATYGLMVGSALAHAPLILIMFWGGLTLVLAISPWGIVTPYINERFPTGVRASGYGIGYSLAVIIPSFYSFYLLGLSRLMPYEYTPLVLMFAAGVFAVLGAWLGPETRDVELHTFQPGRAADAAPAATVERPRPETGG